MLAWLASKLVSTKEVEEVTASLCETHLREFMRDLYESIKRSGTTPEENALCDEWLSQLPSKSKDMMQASTHPVRKDLWLSSPSERS